MTCPSYAWMEESFLKASGISDKQQIFWLIFTEEDMGLRGIPRSVYPPHPPHLPHLPLGMYGSFTTSTNPTIQASSVSANDVTRIDVNYKRSSTKLTTLKAMTVVDATTMFSLPVASTSQSTAPLPLLVEFPDLAPSPLLSPHLMSTLLLPTRLLLPTHLVQISLLFSTRISPPLF